MMSSPTQRRGGKGVTSMSAFKSTAGSENGIGKLPSNPAEPQELRNAQVAIELMMMMNFMVLLFITPRM